MRSTDNWVWVACLLKWMRSWHAATPPPQKKASLTLQKRNSSLKLLFWFPQEIQCQEKSSKLTFDLVCTTLKDLSLAGSCSCHFPIQLAQQCLSGQQWHSGSQLLSPGSRGTMNPNNCQGGWRRDRVVKKTKLKSLFNGKLEWKEQK